jgi:glucokinase
MSKHRTFIARSEAKPPFFVGVDLGGTNVKLGIVDDLGRPLCYRRIKTQSETGPEDGARRMGQAACQLIDEAGLTTSDIAGVGLGSPGTMDIPAGMLLEPHNLPGWFDFPIRDRLAHHCGYPITFSNDAGAAAYGEYWVGSGKDFDSMILLTLGTGVGGGIIVGDLSIDGEHSHGAECGHIIIDSRDDALICPCGQPGHLEGYASATAVVSRVETALAAGANTSLRQRLEAGEELTPLLLAKEAEAGDEFSLEVVLETARYLGIGIVTLMHTIDPAGVVLGGGMTFGGHGSPLGRQFLERVKQEVQRRAFPVPASKTVIDYATLGGDAGYIGSAGLARLASRRKTISASEVSMPKR